MKINGNISQSEIKELIRNHGLTYTKLGRAQLSLDKSVIALKNIIKKQDKEQLLKSKKFLSQKTK